MSIKAIPKKKKISLQTKVTAEIDHHTLRTSTPLQIRILLRESGFKVDSSGEFLGAVTSYEKFDNNSKVFTQIISTIPKSSSL